MTFYVYEIIEDKKTKVQEEEEEWVSEIIGSEDDELKRLLQEF